MNPGNPNIRIPKAWQDHILRDTEFGRKAAVALQSAAEQYPASMHITSPIRFGNRLAVIIEREIGDHVDCTKCTSEVGRLNFMTASEIRSQINSIADSIVIRGKTKAPRRHQRIVCRLFPWAARIIVRRWIRECLSDTSAE